MKELYITELVGETLTHIDVSEEKSEILLTTESGRKILIHHYQDCCEQVEIEGTEGEWQALVGKRIVLATKDEEDGSGKPNVNCESATLTTLVFKVADATVISRWIGQSHGFYSESVDIAELVDEY